MVNLVSNINNKQPPTSLAKKYKYWSCIPPTSHHKKALQQYKRHPLSVNLRSQKQELVAASMKDNICVSYISKWHSEQL